MNGVCAAAWEYHMQRTSQPWLHHDPAGCTTKQNNLLTLLFHTSPHAERTNKVNNYTVDACGTSHFTMGDGGNVENLRAVYVTSADGVANGVS